MRLNRRLLAFGILFWTVFTLSLASFSLFRMYQAYEWLELYAAAGYMLAQAGVAEDPGMGMLDYLVNTLGVPFWVASGIVFAASILNVFVSDRVPFIGKLISFLALSFGKARNDPSRQ